MHDWKKEFGEDYDIPKEITDKYPDASWHNDSSPSFFIVDENHPQVVKDEKGGVTLVPDQPPFYYMHLWVEHPDPDKRELPLKRFEVVVHGDCDGIGLCSSEEFDEEFQTNLRIVEKFAKEHGLAHIVKHGGVDFAKPVCSCGNRNMASMGWDIICSECHKYCGEIH